MQSRIEKLNPASFRGVDFLVPEESTERGQKIAIHEYPNSDKRFVEPLGKLPPIITLTCIIHGDDFFQERDLLEKALEIPGLGELVHPIYGTIQVQPGPFTVSSNQREVGKFVFNAIFYSSTAVSPKALPPTKSKITQLADLSRNAFDNALEINYTDPLDGTELTDDSFSMDAALDGIQDAVDSVVGPIESFAATANSKIANFKNKIFRIMQTAKGLKDTLKDTYNSVLQLTLLPDQLKSAWNDLLNFGNAETGPTNTVKRSRTSNNAAIIQEHTRLTGLAGAYESAAYTDFQTVGELEDTIGALDDSYTDFFEDKDNTHPNMILLADDISVKEAMTNLKVATRISLDSQLTNIWRVVETISIKSSMSLTSYRYYETLDNLDIITELNPGVNSSNFNEKISVVTK